MERVYKEHLVDNQMELILSIDEKLNVGAELIIKDYDFCDMYNDSTSQSILLDKNQAIDLAESILKYFNVQ